MPIHMRLPKLKGFRNAFRVEYQVVNLGQAGRALPAGRAGLAGRRWSRPARSARALRSRCWAPATWAGSSWTSPRTPSRRARRTRSLPPAAASPRCSQRRPARAGRGWLGRTGDCPASPASTVTVASPADATGHLLLGSQQHRRFASTCWQPGPVGGLEELHKTEIELHSRRRMCAHRVRVCIPDARPAQEAALHAGHDRAVPAGCLAAHPEHQQRGDQRLYQVGQRHQPDRLCPDQPVLRRRAAQALGLRAGHHALHHRQHHRPAAGGGDPAVRDAEEGGPVRPAEAHPVQPLPDHRAGDPAVLRLHRAGPVRPAVLRRHRLPPAVPAEHLRDGHHGGHHDRRYRRW